MERIKNILKFIALVVLILVVNRFPMVLIANQDKTPAVLWGVLSIGYLVAASAIIWQLWRRYRARQTEAVNALRFGWGDFGIAFLFYIGTRVVAIVGTILIQIFTGNPTSANDAALSASTDQLLNMFPLYFVAFQFTLGLFAPVMEELVFRGFFSQYFFNKKWLKLVVSSTIFALLHVVHPIEFVMYFGLGAIFYLAYSRRGNLVDSIAVHMLNNSLIVIFSIIGYLLLLFG